MEAEYYKWYSKEDNVEPISGETIICVKWYDYWNYDVGYYIKETKEIRFYEREDNRISIFNVDKWMMIKEPSVE